jgi:hypothetical protein
MVVVVFIKPFDKLLISLHGQQLNILFPPNSFLVSLDLDVDVLQAASLYEKASKEEYLQTHLFLVFGLAFCLVK